MKLMKRNPYCVPVLLARALLYSSSSRTYGLAGSMFSCAVPTVAESSNSGWWGDDDAVPVATALPSCLT